MLDLDRAAPESDPAIPLAVNVDESQTGEFQISEIPRLVDADAGPEELNNDPRFPRASDVAGLAARDGEKS
jgi:hypothetical protein